MYYAYQIVYDLDNKKPVRASDAFGDGSWGTSPKNLRTTHFIRDSGGDYDVALPRSLKEAQDLLNKGIIQPAPCAATHCWKCRNWLSNHKDNKPCQD